MNKFFMIFSYKKGTIYYSINNLYFSIHVTDLNISKTYRCSNIEESFRYPCFPILNRIGRIGCSGIARTTPLCQNSPSDVRQQFNLITAFVDGSQIYGSDAELQEKLRELEPESKFVSISSFQFIETRCTYNALDNVK